MLNTIIDCGNSFARTWAWWIGMSIVDATIVLAVVSLLWFAIRRRTPPQLGYWLFLLVPLKLFVPFEIAVPERLVAWAPSLASRATSQTPAVAPRSEAGPLEMPIAMNPLPAPLAAPLVEPRVIREDRPIASENLAAPTATIAVAAPHKLSLQAWFMLGWAFGILVLLARLVRSQVRFHRVIMRNAKPVNFDSFPVDFSGLMRRIRVARHVRVVESESVSSPVVWGVFRPMLILPSGISSSLSAGQLEWVLLHELAHVRRRDLAVRCFQCLTTILHFVNPAIWIANRMIDRLREYACDDMASAFGNGSQVESGEAFLGVMRFSASIQHRCETNLDGALGVFESGARASCFERMRRLLDTNRRISVRLGLGSICVLLLTAALALPQIRAANPPAADEKVAEKEKKEPQSKEAATEIPTDRGITVVGKVTDEAGKPIAGAAVYAWFDKYERDAETNENGEYQLLGCKPARGGIEVSAKGWSIDPKRVEIASDMGPVDFKMKPGRKIRIHVLDNGGKPVEGTNIQVCSCAKGHSKTAVWNYVCDANGQSVVDLPQSVWVLRIALSKNGHLKLVADWDLLSLVTGRQPPKDVTMQLTKLNLKQAQAVAEIEKLNGTVIVNQNNNRQRVTVQLLGENDVDAGLAILRRLPAPDELVVLSPNLTDASLVHLESMHSLKTLTLGFGKITDAGLTHIKGLRELKELRLVGAKITDAGLVHLQSLQGLNKLSLNCAVTDAGMKHLMPLRELRTLISRSVTADPATEKLFNALERPATMHFTNAPLADVCDYLRSTTDSKLQIDERALENVNASGETAVTCNVMNVPFGQGLREVLGPLGLDWMVEGDALIITTRDVVARKYPGVSRLWAALPELKQVIVAEDKPSAPRATTKPATKPDRRSVESAKTTGQNSGRFHLVRGNTTWIGTDRTPFVYDDYDKNFYMSWGDHVVVLPKHAEGFQDFYGYRTLSPGVERTDVSREHSTSDRLVNISLPGAIDLPAYQLLLQPSVQQALKLSAEQRTKLQDISAKYWPERRRIAGEALDDMESASRKEMAAYTAKARHGIVQSHPVGINSPFSEEVVEKLERQWSDARKQIEDVLTPEQLRTLKDLTFRTFAFGSGMMFEPAVLEMLGVAKSRQDELETLELQLQKEKNRRLRSVTRERMTKMLAVLTPRQLSQLREKHSPKKNPDQDCSMYPYPGLPSHMPDTGVADELGFSKEQRERVRKIVSVHWASLSALQEEVQTLQAGDEKGFKAVGEKRRQEMANLRKQIGATLTPEQWASCKEMAFQNLAIPSLRLVAQTRVSKNASAKERLSMALYAAQVAGMMGLTERQRTALKEIDAEYFDKPEQVYRELTDKALAAFTPAQQEQLRAEVDRCGW